MPGKVVRFEIPANDVKKASAFYEDVFGWWTTGICPAWDYTMLGGIKVSDMGELSESGSIRRRDDEEIPTPLNNPSIRRMGVDEIGASPKTIDKKKEGGKTLRKKQDRGWNMGFTAYFIDTEGDVVPKRQKAAQPSPQRKVGGSSLRGPLSLRCSGVGEKTLERWCHGSVFNGCDITSKRDGDC